MRHILNTTFIIEEEAEREWVDFMRQDYIRTIETLHVTEDRLFTKVSIDQPEGKTYSLQLIFSSEEAREHFEQYHWQKITARLNDRFNNR